MILLDGSCGSLLWKMADERGIKKEETWKYNLTNPELVVDMLKRYVNVGVDMIQTNTFAANAISVKRSSDYDVKDVISNAVKVSKEATKGTNIKVYLSSGPLPQLLKPLGPISNEECEKCYEEIFEAAAKEGVEAIMLETFMDVEMMAIAARQATNYGIPVICSMTFEKKQRTMMGNTIGQICRKLEPLGISGIGMNCSKGPVEGLEIIKSFKETTSLPLYFKPNAGMAETYTAKDFANEIKPSLEYVQYIGGCCGTDENYIKEIKNLIK